MSSGSGSWGRCWQLPCFFSRARPLGRRVYVIGSESIHRRWQGRLSPADRSLPTWNRVFGALAGASPLPQGAAQLRTSDRRLHFPPAHDGGLLLLSCHLWGRLLTTIACPTMPGVTLRRGLRSRSKVPAVNHQLSMGAPESGPWGCGAEPLRRSSLDGAEIVIAGGRG